MELLMRTKNEPSEGASGQPKDQIGNYLTAKTQIAPPSGTSGYSPGN